MVFPNIHESRKERLLRSNELGCSGSVPMRARPVDDTLATMAVRACQDEAVPEPHHAHEALNESEEQLRHMQKMEAVGRLAGGVAHDFNNLLTVILGYSELVLGSLPPADARSQDLEQVIRAGRSAAALTRQFLALSRRQVLERRVLSLNDLIAGLGKMIRRLITEDIEFVTALTPNCWNIEADPGQLEQVLINLTVNAHDAMPQGGRLVIRTENLAWAQLAEARSQMMSPGDYLSLTVSDNGIGMKDDVRSKVFEPFFTTKETGRGTGLGLSIVHGIVEQSGGHIFVTSRPGQGSTFEIYLPRSNKGLSGSKEATAFVDKEGSETILLAEDNSQVRAFTHRILNDVGYRVIEARDGAEALELSERYGRDIQLVITDVVMPFLSGPELAQCLSHSLPGVKLLYVSGYADEALHRHGVLPTNIPMLRKPFTHRGLRRAVRHALDGTFDDGL